MSDIDDYIEAEGPFDAVMAFSQGAIVAATYIVHKAQQDAEQQDTRPPFKFAVFFSGGAPIDLVALKEGSWRVMNAEADGEVVHIPTVNVWGASEVNDPTWGPPLGGVCEAKLRQVIVHPGVHEIPTTKNKASLMSTVDAIRKTISLT